jgi:4-alpha-glucanotransferase
LPHNYTHNTVVYTGTHDNNTTRGWFEMLPEQGRQKFWAYMKRAPGEAREAAPELMRLAWSSNAALAIAPFQDLLNLGGSARMNVPGQAGSNWRWRMIDDMLSPADFDWLGELTKESNRSAGDAATTELPAVLETEVTR